MNLKNKILSGSLHDADLVKKASIIVDLNFGDSGKGSIVAAISQQLEALDIPTLNIRFNGGAQAAHNVVFQKDNGEWVHHCFHQFGSGTPFGSHTYLSRWHLLDLFALETEVEELALLLNVPEDTVRSWITISPHCMVVTPFHKIANQMKAMGSGVQNTCGMGIGETVRVGSFRAGATTEEIDFALLNIRDGYIHDGIIIPLHESVELYSTAMLHILQKYRIEDVDIFNRYPIFEGAQGIGLDGRLDPEYGTWSDCTMNNPVRLLQEFGCHNSSVVKYGLTRTYLTRHGDGNIHGGGNLSTGNIPLPDFFDSTLIDTFEHNTKGIWQGEFRTASLKFSEFSKRISYLNVNGCRKEEMNLVVNHCDAYPAPYWLDRGPYFESYNLAILGFGPAQKVIIK
jgi:adenylosuccinate synthase